MWRESWESTESLQDDKQPQLQRFTADPERTAVRADSLEAGLAVKYLIMKRCRDGTLQQQNTMALAAMIPGKKTDHGQVENLQLLRIRKPQEMTVSEPPHRDSTPTWV